MEHHATVFDHCQTADAIHAHLQQLARELLAVTSHADWSQESKINFAVITELSYADIKQHPHPVRVLSEMCRLLFKSGDNRSLTHSLALAHKIYAFKCAHNESWYVSYLYKGIAQIGLQLTDLGVKNVLLGIAEHSDFSVVPVDKALGYWALMSAAILTRNLKLALTFAGHWLAAAQQGHLDGEILRARLATQIFHLILGNTAVCAAGIQSLLTNAQAEWQNLVNFLAEWTQVITTELYDQGEVITCHGEALRNHPGEIASSRTPRNDTIHLELPYPLFLGVAWHQASRGVQLNAMTTVDDFQSLCRIRRSLSHNNALHTLVQDELEQYAHLMVQWELPRPFQALETVLKDQDREAYFQHAMARLLGKSVLKKILTETATEPEIATRSNAIILVMDVRKYSALSEQRTSEELFALLNPIFKIMSEELEPIGGTILEFVGDCIIVVFNTFQEQPTGIAGILSHTAQCLRRIYVHNALSLHTGLPEIRIGVGIHKGPVSVGYLGGLGRCHLTVLGNTINLASRLETASKDLPADVIVSVGCFDHTLPEVWANPLHVHFAIRDFGLYAGMKNISQPLHVFGISPLLRYWVDFVPIGLAVCPEPGVMYLDAGNSIQPGIIDHRCATAQVHSSCELLVQQPQLLLKHVHNTPRSQLEFRFHAAPDLDCAASFYTACELLTDHPRQELLHKLAAYLHEVNRGRPPHVEQIADSLYGVYKAHDVLVKQHAGVTVTDLVLLEAGVRVIDAAFFLLEQYADGDLATIFQFRPEWFREEREWLQTDRVRYVEDVKLRGHSYLASVNGIPEPVTGLWLDHPQSVLFKMWAWDDPNAPGGRGYPFIAFEDSHGGKHHFTIGVDSAVGTNLNGLGQLLEAHETRKRKELGKERPIHPIRYPADNSDPWYFGQGHAYTLVASPWGGTVLTAEEIQQIHASWQQE
jgi:class 3 adenylate cyclase